MNLTEDQRNSIAFVVEVELKIRPIYLNLNDGNVNIRIQKKTAKHKALHIVTTSHPNFLQTEVYNTFEQENIYVAYCKTYEQILEIIRQYINEYKYNG